jgi:hypothetical protein
VRQRVRVDCDLQHAALPIIFEHDDTLLPRPPLLETATSPKQHITPVVSPRPQLERLDRESENLLQRHSPRRNVSTLELGSTDLGRMPEMNVGKGGAAAAGGCHWNETISLRLASSKV